jgi:uncharacterized membrane protein
MPNNRNYTFEIISKYLKSEKVIINFDELKLQLLSHPSFPSLHSVTGVLDHFNIENLALEVPVNTEVLNQLPKTFISLISNKERIDLVLVNQLNKKIEISYGDKSKKYITKDEFIDLWRGIIVIIEKDSFETSNSIQNDFIFKNIIYVISLILTVGIFFFFNPSIFQSFHYILTITGVGVSLLLVKHELGFQSKTVDKFCSGGNELTDCDAVLNSKGASIIKNFKLSDISLIYFTGILISWIISIQHSNDNSLIIILSLITLPVTLYSIFYQYFIVKKWCPLCLSIVVVLWLQISTIPLINNPFTSITFKLSSIFILFFSFLLVFSFWFFVKPLLKKQNELGKLRVEYYKFKRNFTLFDAVYSKASLYDTIIDASKEIIFGNKNALIKILLVTNPSCFYCRLIHRELNDILKKNPEDINITFRFNIPQPHDKDNISSLVASRLLEIYNTTAQETIDLALDEAYKNEVDLNEWLLKWKVSDDQSYENILKIQQKWCYDNNINFTPAFFINGKQYPKEYESSDLNYFIEELIERIKKEKSLDKEPVYGT